MYAYEDAGRIGKETMESATQSLSALTRGFQRIAAQNGDFAKQNYEQSAQMIEKLTQVRSLDRAFEVQGDFARASYERWATQATKMGELYAEIAREAYKPYEGLAADAARKGADFAERAADDVEKAA